MKPSRQIPDLRLRNLVAPISVEFMRHWRLPSAYHNSLLRRSPLPMQQAEPKPKTCFDQRGAKFPLYPRHQIPDHPNSTAESPLYNAPKAVNICPEGVSKIETQL